VLASGNKAAAFDAPLGGASFADVYGGL
jgi:hypothetical protein